MVYSDLFIITMHMSKDNELVIFERRKHIFKYIWGFVVGLFVLFCGVLWEDIWLFVWAWCLLFIVLLITAILNLIWPQTCLRVIKGNSQTIQGYYSKFLVNSNKSGISG